MSAAQTGQVGVSRIWHWFSGGLAIALVLSWAILGYAVVDSAVSLNHCGMEQAGLRRDVAVLVRASQGRLSREALLAARAELLPELEAKLEEDGSVLLSSGALEFGQDGLLRRLKE